MGMSDAIWNGRNDPTVIEWRKKRVAANNIFADWRNHSFYSKLCGTKAKEFKDYVLNHESVKDLGELPESEEAIYQLMASLTR